jgi:hypothetical protein
MSLLNRFLGFFKKEKQSNVRQEKIGLYYDKMHGAAGHIYCTECSCIVMIDVWIHDYANTAIKTSYQCLNCGKFANISLLKDHPIPDCACSGELSNKHKLFCPQCKSDKLQYSCYYFT